MSEHLGRPLKDDEHVHHIDGNKTNNHITNLSVTTRSDHTRLHNLDKIITRDCVGRINRVHVRRTRIER
ncbi:MULTISPECIES: HNH endonuclease [Paenibacillus]|uniref:HNH endonuclease n=1 Tax=Paenibacillus TaxID=44249 RepID=UPI0035A245E1